MEQNTGGIDVDRLMELWRTYSTGAIGVCNDAQRMQDFVAEIVSDEERKNNAVGNLNAKGLSIEQVQEKLTGAQNIKAAIVAEFPNAIQ